MDFNDRRKGNAIYDVRFTVKSPQSKVDSPQPIRLKNLAFVRFNSSQSQTIYKPVDLPALPLRQKGLSICKWVHIPNTEYQLLTTAF
jgi:hypothetical protein